MLDSPRDVASLSSEANGDNGNSLVLLATFNRTRGERRTLLSSCDMKCLSAINRSRMKKGALTRMNMIIAC